MKKVLLITNYTNLPGEKGYNRFKYLCEILSDRGFKVTCVTSVFNHYDKSKRNKETFDSKTAKYRIVLLNEKGYKKNISVKRIMSQRQFAYNLRKFLKIEGKSYDCFYCCVPSLEAAQIAGDFANKNNILFIEDIQDLWPEAIKVVIKNDFLFNILTLSWKKKADNVYKKADKLIAVSKEYLDRAKKVNDRAGDSAYVYIGTFVENFDNGAKKYFDSIKKNKDDFWVIYIGTLGASYDIKTLISAYKILLDRGYGNIKLKILGRGPEENQFKKHAEKNNVKVDFLGYKKYDEMAAYLKKSDIAINAIKKNASQSIINKVGDYFSAGLPVLNGCNCKEMIDLIEKYNTGINYISEDPKSLANSIITVYKMEDCSYQQICKNSRNLALEKFDRKKTYSAILKMLE